MFSIHTAARNLIRRIPRSVLIFLLSGSTVFFLCIYLAFMEASQNQLQSLPQAIPVDAYIANLKGTQRVGLQIKGSLLDYLEQSGEVTDLLSTLQLAANPAPEADEEALKPKRIVIAGANDSKAYPALDFNVDPSFWGKDDPVCMPNQSYMETNHLNIGDFLPLAIYYYAYEDAFTSIRYVFLGRYNLTIVGSFESVGIGENARPPDVFCSLPWVVDEYAKKEIPFYVDSLSFRLKNPLELNAFKAQMKDQKLLSVNPQSTPSFAGNALVIKDETFIRSATSLNNKISLLTLFFPVLVIVVLLLGFVVANVSLQSRKDEYAIERLLGTSRSSCFWIFFWESAFLSLMGGIGGVAFVPLVFPISWETAAPVVAGFVLAYLIGNTAAILTFSRQKVTKLLSTSE